MLDDDGEQRDRLLAEELPERPSLVEARLGLALLQPGIAVDGDVDALGHLPLREAALVADSAEMIEVAHAGNIAGYMPGMSMVNLPAHLTGSFRPDSIALVLVTLGQELARLREAKGLTQIEVARAIGYSDSSKISLIESDQRRPGKSTLARLASALGTDPKHLQSFGGAYNPRAPKTTRRQKRSAVAAGHGGADLPSGAAASGADGGDPLKDLLYDMFMMLPPGARREWLQRLAVATRLEETSEPAHPKSKAGGDA